MTRYCWLISQLRSSPGILIIDALKLISEYCSYIPGRDSYRGYLWEALWTDWTLRDRHYIPSFYGGDVS